MKKRIPITLVMLLMITTTFAFAADNIVGKKGESVSGELLSPVSAASDVFADIQYNTTGTMDLPATLGGDREGWGTEFITRWTNDTESPVTIVEFGWPCAGWWAQFWKVWITDTLPEDPYSSDFHGSFVAVNEDEFAFPPNPYTYINVTAENIIIPAGGTMYFGYSNPGMGGQISGTDTETWAYYEDAWDSDTNHGRTAVLQFKGMFAVVANETSTFSHVKALFR